MFRSDIEKWLGVVTTISRECEWDPSLVISMQTDERTYVIQVRKSPLMFIVNEEPARSGNYAVAYTVYPSVPEETARRVSAGKSRAPGFVEEQLEQWLREYVARYAVETKLPD